MRELSATSLYLCGRIFSGASQIIMLRVLTEVLSPRELGRYYLATTIVGFASLAGITPLTVYVTRHIHQWIAARVVAKGIRLISAASLAIAVFFFTIVVVLTHGSWLGNEPLVNGAPFLLPALLLTGAIAAYIPECLNVLGEQLSFVVLSNVDIWGKTGVMILAAALGSNTAENVLIAIIGWNICFSILASAVIFRSLARQPSQACAPFELNIRDIISFAWPVAAATSLYWCQSDGFRLVLGGLLPMDDVGRFIVAFNIGAALMVAGDTLFGQVCLPRFYYNIAHTASGEIRTAWNWYGTAFVKTLIPFALITSFACPLLMRWLVAGDYAAVSEIGSMAVGAYLLRAFNGICYNGLVAQKRTAALIVPSAVGGVLAIGGTATLTSAMGVPGAAVALLVSYIASAVIMWYQLRRHSGVTLSPQAILLSVALAAPVCITLAVGNSWGWAATKRGNLLLLGAAGVSLIAIQLVHGREVWIKHSKSQ